MLQVALLEVVSGSVRIRMKFTFAKTTCSARRHCSGRLQVMTLFEVAWRRGDHATRPAKKGAAGDFCLIATHLPNKRLRYLDLLHFQVCFVFVAHLQSLV